METKGSSVTVKLQGSTKQVELVLDQLRELYKLIIVGQIMPNDKDDGIHVFLNIDPSLVNEKEKPQQIVMASERSVRKAKKEK